jgi:hypothetical protein
MEHPIEVLVSMLVASAALVPVLLKLSCEPVTSQRPAAVPRSERVPRPFR